MRLPFHYLANDPHRRTKIPTQFASFGELKRLTGVVRRYGRVWQATPPKDSRWQTLRNFALTSGRLFGRPAEGDGGWPRWMWCRIARLAAWPWCSRGCSIRHCCAACSACRRWRAPFKVYADGILTPLAEETPALRELNEPDLEDGEARRALLRDEGFRARFRACWYGDKRGLSLARLKRALGLMDDTLRRDLADMVMTDRPQPQWRDHSLAEIYTRYRAWVGGGTVAAEDAQAFEPLGRDIADDCDFFLALLEAYDTDLRWYVLAANDRPEVLRKLLFEEQILPGFNDSGAHLTNMAFYDGNLRGLRLAQEQGFAAVARHVRRLTLAPAEFFGLDVGRLSVGAPADLLLPGPAGATPLRQRGAHPARLPRGLRARTDGQPLRWRGQWRLDRRPAGLDGQGLRAGTGPAGHGPAAARGPTLGPDDAGFAAYGRLGP